MTKTGRGCACVMEARVGIEDRKERVDYVRHTVDLPRPTKRIISMCTDAVMMPLALWAAMSLKAGYPTFDLADWPAYVAVVLQSAFRYSFDWACTGRSFAFSATRPYLPLPLRSR